jgi:transposase InsO family protein
MVTHMILSLLMIIPVSLGCSFCKIKVKHVVLKKFLRRAQNEFDAKVKKIRSDNGTKFKNTQVEDFLDEEGIKHEFFSPYTPQQNRLAERKNRTLIEIARTMLDEYKSLDQFWVEAINTTCHATNCLYLHKLIKNIL